MTNAESTEVGWLLDLALSIEQIGGMEGLWILNLVESL